MSALRHSVADPTPAASAPPPAEAWRTILTDTARAIRGNPVARVTAALVAVLIVPQVVPIVSPEYLGLITEYLAETALALLFLVALRYGFGEIESKRERRFWNLVTMAAGLTFVTEVARLLLSDEWWSRLPLFTTDVVALLSYFLIFGAVELKPHLQGAATLRRKIEIAASMVFALAVCAYLIAIPAFGDLYYDAFAPAMFTFTVLDFVLAIRAWSIARRCSHRGWRAVYWWLGVSYAVWGVLDLVESLIYSYVIPDFPPGTPLDLLWYVPYLTLVVFALLKGQRAAALDGAGDTVRDEQEAQISATPAPLVVYAFLFALLHLTIASLNLFGRRGGFAENTFTLTVLLILAGMASAQQRLLAGERQQALAEARDARDAAEAASRAKMQFLASMSHEVRTPINGVLGMLELLTYTDLSERQSRFAKTAQQAGKHLLHVINGVLDISKIEAGKLLLNNSEFALHEALEETVHIFADDARQKGLELACDIGDEVPRRAVGDEGRLRQIVANLIGNAVKFTAEGGVLVTVDRRAGEGVVLRVSVKDTGIGVLAEEQERLFEAFTQADDSITRKHGGTGLGLAIARQLCEAMGGQIGVRSQPGLGSDFCFTVPLGEAETPARRADALRLSDEPNRPGPPDGRPEKAEAGARATLDLRVLLVEDDAVNVEVALGMLDHSGCRVDVCSNGLEALDAIRRSDYDVILMDCRMPEMDGYEATKIIRQREGGRPRVPIVALTAHALADERERCLAAGMDGYLSKPFERKELLGVLEGLRGVLAT